MTLYLATITIKQIFKIRPTKFAQKVLDAVNSDKEYAEILAKMKEVYDKKKGLIKEHNEIIKLIHQADDEYNELEHKRVACKTQISKQVAAKL